MQAQFRNTTWGMTKAEVKQTESLELTESDDEILVYETSFLGLDTYIFFAFNSGNLVSGGYAFNNKHTNDNNYIEDYHSIKELLTEKYGEPESDEVNWTNDSWKHNKNEWGYAISQGHLEYFSGYELDKLYIEHALVSDNYLGITHTIKYFDPKYVEKMMEEDLDKL